MGSWSLCSEEVNFLIYRYLQESGFTHSAFCFGNESQVTRSLIQPSAVPPAALITMLQKGTQMLQVESQMCGDDNAPVAYEWCYELIAKSSKRQRKAGVSTQDCDDVPMSDSKKRRKHQSDEETTQPPTTTLTHTPQGDARPAAAPQQMRVEAILQGHEGQVFTCSWQPGGNALATGSGDATARLWFVGPAGKSRTDSIQCKILDHPKSTGVMNGEDDQSLLVTTLDWSPDGKLIATGSNDGRARIWGLDGNLKATLSHHTDAIFALKWNPEGKYILTASTDCTAVLWDVKLGKAKQTFSNHDKPTLDVDWKDNTTFATCSQDTTIVVSRLGDKTAVKKWVGHTKDVNAIQWAPTGTFLASCSDDNTCKIWSLSSETAIHTLTEHSNQLYTIKWAPTTTPPDTNQNSSSSSSTPAEQMKHLLATCSGDSTVKLWSICKSKAECISTLTGHTKAVCSVGFSANGQYLASGSLDQFVNVWSVRDGALVRTYECDGQLFEVSWDHHSGTRLASCGCLSNNTVAVFDAAV
eukprot:TRINITY_DN67900_c6_g1_i1.p1 TRINITY_DN67900_c6_g1~~TRINITY_DN67900_c6_g1_i1.p1  ORF type:complete len:526 (-),score=34.79 TRINITY_DN67900_c6_g1_i1:1237-2814(-)